MLGSLREIHPIPDHIEPMIGYKGLRVKSNYGKMVLRSPDQMSVWPSKQPIIAACDHEDQRDKCNCGINAFKDQDTFLKSSYSKHEVMAQIAMWGEVQEYDTGYRSEYAYPLSLTIFDDKTFDSTSLKKELENIYGVEVNVLQRDSEEYKEKKNSKINIPIKDTVANIFLCQMLIASFLYGVSYFFVQKFASTNEFWDKQIDALNTGAALIPQSPWSVCVVMSLVFIVALSMGLIVHKAPKLPSHPLIIVGFLIIFFAPFFPAVYEEYKTTKTYKNDYFIPNNHGFTNAEGPHVDKVFSTLGWEYSKKKPTFFAAGDKIPLTKENDLCIKVSDKCTHTMTLTQADIVSMMLEYKIYKDGSCNATSHTNAIINKIRACRAGNKIVVTKKKIKSEPKSVSKIRPLNS